MPKIQPAPVTENNGDKVILGRTIDVSVPIDLPTQPPADVEEGGRSNVSSISNQDGPRAELVNAMYQYNICLAFDCILTTLAVGAATTAFVFLENAYIFVTAAVLVVPMVLGYFVSMETSKRLRRIRRLEEQIINGEQVLQQEDTLDPVQMYTRITSLGTGHEPQSN